jgi:hypothetical protein
MLTGFFSTLLLPETKGRSLEYLSNEDQEGFIKGECFFFPRCGPFLIATIFSGVAAPNPIIPVPAEQKTVV